MLDIGGINLDYRALLCPPDAYVDRPWWPGGFTAFNESADIVCALGSDAEVAAEISAAKLLSETKNGLTLRQVYGAAKGRYLWVQTDTGKNPMIVFRAHPGFGRFELMLDRSETCGRFAFECFLSLFNLAALTRGRIIFHGVLMECSGKGFIISAPSGTGKTTHARFWREKENALIIDGDLALCYKSEAGWIAAGMPWCGSSGESINRSVPLCGIVALERGETNSGARINAVTAFTKLYKGLLLPRWNEKLTETGTDLFCSLLEDVPFYSFSCRPEEESVDALKEVLSL